MRTVEEEIQLNISQLLTLPAFSGARLVAGKAGTERSIEHVNMMDAPDIAGYLKGNDLLVTTAYHFKDDASQLVELIETMAEKRCAGLGIKAKRFLGKIPEEAVALANAHGLPIIELSEEIGLGTIVNQTLSAILDLRTNELKAAIEAHQTFSDHIVSGKGVGELLENVAKIVGCSIMLLDERCQLVGTTHASRTIVSGLQYLNRMGYQLFLPQTAYTHLSMISEKGQVEVLTVFPVRTNRPKQAMLVMFGTIPALENGHLLTIEQAANVVAFELMKNNALQQYTRRAKNDFFLNFIKKAYSSKKETLNRALEFDLHNDQKYKCIAGRLDTEEKQLGFKQRQIEIEKVFDFIEEEMTIFPFVSHLFIMNDICLILVEGESEELASEEYSPTLIALEIIQERVAAHFDRTISFGVSNVCHEFWDVIEAHGEAINALNSGHLSGNKQFVQTYQAKDISKLLRMIPNEDLAEFCAYMLQKLSGAQVNDLSLLQTLAVYLETHCQISETAKRLYVHRNTIIYRLEKIEELLGKDIKDPETTLHLRLALRIQQMLSEQSDLLEQPSVDR